LLLVPSQAISAPPASQLSIASASRSLIHLLFFHANNSSPLGPNINNRASGWPAHSFIHTSVPHTRYLPTLAALSPARSPASTQPFGPYLAPTWPTCPTPELQAVLLPILPPAQPSSLGDPKLQRSCPAVLCPCPKFQGRLKG
jgi:hypothetical protein